MESALGILGIVVTVAFLAGASRRMGWSPPLVHLAPVLLGDGVRLFDHAGGRRFPSERTAPAQGGQLTDLRCRVQAESHR